MVSKFHEENLRTILDLEYTHTIAEVLYNIDKEKALSIAMDINMLDMFNNIEHEEQGSLFEDTDMKTRIIERD